MQELKIIMFLLKTHFWNFTKTFSSLKSFSKYQRFPRPSTFRTPCRFPHFLATPISFLLLLLLLLLIPLLLVTKIPSPFLSFLVKFEPSIVINVHGSVFMLWAFLK